MLLIVSISIWLPSSCTVQDRPFLSSAEEEDISKKKIKKRFQYQNYFPGLLLQFLICPSSGCEEEVWAHNANECYHKNIKQLYWVRPNVHLTKNSISSQKQMPWEQNRHVITLPLSTLPTSTNPSLEDYLSQIMLMCINLYVFLYGNLFKLHLNPCKL